LLSSFFTSAPFALPEKSKIKCLSIWCFLYQII
jgi:hypothetical protein